MILVCGEALIDLVARPSPGDGAPPTYAAVPGGGPANTAVALARLGQPVQLLARLSADAFGVTIREHLRRNGVGLDLAVTAAEPTTLAVAGLAPDGAARYSFYLTGTADWQWTPDELPDRLPPGTLAVHAGSLALALPPGADLLTGFLARAKEAATIVVDPNVRPAAIGDLDRYRQRVESWLAIADLVKASDEDLAALYPDTDPVEAAHAWAAAGPAAVVVTAGAAGSLAVVGGAVVRVPACPVEVVDTVGAGDAYGAALLAALGHAGALGGRLDGVSPATVETALGFAARVAAATCARRGADPPHRADLGAG